VVRAKPGVSGRFDLCIPISKWRDGAYRVQKRLLHEWGGLSVNDGFIQRSASFPQEPGALSYLAGDAGRQPPVQEQLMAAPAEPET
jgi:hypothetical protein